MREREREGEKNARYFKNTLSHRLKEEEVKANEKVDDFGWSLDKELSKSFKIVKNLEEETDR